MSIIIAGGGMTGTILAKAISQLTFGKLQVHLVEALIPQNDKHPGFDVRTITLAQNICHQLAFIGIWQIIANYATPIYSVHISDKGHAGCATIEACDYCIDSLGQVIELHNIGLHLFHLLQKSPGVIIHCPARIVSISRNKESVNVILDNNKTIDGKLLVIANGSNSLLATQCGITWQKSYYDQAAVVANITTTVKHKNRAWERFTEYGPLAILPISQDRCSLVWCHTLKHINKVMSWSDEHFCTEIQKNFGWRLGHISYIGNRTVYPLALINAIRFISHRVVLVGNAAQTLHPVAGQGLNLGLRDVISLAEVLSQAWIKRKDYGHYSILKYYQSSRKLDKIMTINITDGLIKLFTNHWTPLVLGRNLGLIILELFTPARNMLVRRVLSSMVTLNKDE